MSSPRSRGEPLAPQTADVDLSESRRRWAESTQRIERLNRTDPNVALREVKNWMAEEDSQGNKEGSVRARRAYANVLRYLGRYTEARTEFDYCKSQFRALGLIDDEYRVNLGLVMVLRYTGELSEAVTLTEDSIRHFESIGDIGETAKHFVNLGVIHRRIGDLSKAEAAYETALKRARAVGDRDREAVACMNLGNLLADLGSFSRALEFLQTALSIYRELGQLSYVAMASSNLGRLQSARGEHGEAIVTLRESRQTYVRLRLPRDRAIIDLYLLRSYRALNLRREAQTACNNAIRTLSSFDMPYEHGQALLTASNIYEDAGKVALAFRRAKQATEVFDRAGIRMWYQISRATTAILGTRVAKGQSIERVQSEISDARIELESLGAAEWVGYLRLWEGDIWKRARAYDDARAAFQDAREQGHRIGSDELIYRSHWSEAQLPDATAERALSHYRMAAEHIERVRLRARASELKTSFLSDKTPLYEAALSVLLQHQRDDTESIFEFAERSRSRSLADSASDTSPRNVGESNEERRLRERLTELRARANKLYDQAYGLSAPSRAAGASVAATEIEQLESLMEKTRQQLFLLRPSLEHSPLASLRDFQATLSDSQAGVAYFEANHQVHALVVTQRNASMTSGLASLDVVRRQARRIQFHVGKAAYGTEYMHAHIDSLREGLNDPLRLLGALLLSPLTSSLADAGELIVLPSAVTYGLPIHALLTEQDQYVAERYTVQYAPSASVRFVNRKRTARTSGEALLVAITDATLPGVRDEVDRLATLLPSAVTLTDSRATIAEFRAHAVGASVVHLATHGVFREDNPAFSGIKFADGWMTAADLSELCRDASLVTLSACETGVGSDQGGGEIMGISQAILGAGCSSLISSLWTADDRSTVELMSDFYTQLSQGKSAPQAMQQAMLAARNRADHPYFWAPFAVFGEGRLPTA